MLENKIIRETVMQLIKIVACLTAGLLLAAGAQAGATNFDDLATGGDSTSLNNRSPYAGLSGNRMAAPARPAGSTSALTTPPVS
jgi:hypothetical protein